MQSLLPIKCVDFRERGKPEYPEKNPRRAGEIKYENSFVFLLSFFFSSERHDALVTLCTQFFRPRKLDSKPTWIDMSFYSLMGTFATFSFNDVKRGISP